MSEMVIGDDGWTEIVGEQTRGGQGPVLGGDAYELLGELIQKSPAFQQLAAKRAAMSRPMTHKTPLQKARDWQIDFGPVSGSASTTTIITRNPQCLFRGEKVMATDTGSTAGLGTSISTILIGQRLQRPAGDGSTLTLFFSQQALGNGVKWDTCDKALTISVTVSFIQQCTFYMTVFGKAVLG